jgi:hypothetical protein
MILKRIIFKIIEILILCDAQNEESDWSTKKCIQGMYVCTYTPITDKLKGKHKYFLFRTKQASFSNRNCARPWFIIKNLTISLYLCMHVCRVLVGSNIRETRNRFFAPFFVRLNWEATLTSATLRTTLLPPIDRYFVYLRWILGSDTFNDSSKKG